MSSTRTLPTVAVAVLAILGCDQRRAIHPLDSGGPALSDLAGVNCETQIIPDPECNNSGAPVGEPYDIVYDSLEVQATASAEAYEDLESAACPRWITGRTTALTRDPSTGYDYEFHSFGTWTIRWLSSLPYLGSSQAIYSWPQNAGGWPAINLDRESGIATIWVDSGRAVCHGGGNVTFIRLYGVRVEDSGLTQTSSGGGGGGTWSGPGGSTCHKEYAIVEVSYDGGATWHTLWEGFATVCE